MRRCGPFTANVRTVRPLAAYLLAPAVLPLAALLYSAFLAEPSCPHCPTPIWAYALPALFFTYPAALVIAKPTLRLLPSSLRSPFSGVPVAGAALALAVFLLFIVGFHGGPSHLMAAAAVVALLGALSASAFVFLLGPQLTAACCGTTPLSVRDYLPFLCLFLAVEGGAYFGQFSCGGYATVRDVFGLVFLVATLGTSFFGRGILTSVPRRVTLFFAAPVLFVMVQAMSSPFYPAPPQALAEFFRLFILGLTDGPC